MVLNVVGSSPTFHPEHLKRGKQHCFPLFLRLFPPGVELHKLDVADCKSAKPKKVRTFFNGGLQIRRAPNGRKSPARRQKKVPRQASKESLPLGVNRKSPARRPGGFEIRRKKRFDLLKPGDL